MITDINVLIGLILTTTLAAIVEAYADGNKIINHQGIEHGFSSLVRLAVIVIASYLLYEAPYFAYVSGVLLSCYWIVFDVSINITRNKNWLYIGSTSTIDKFFNLHSDPLGFLLIKITSLIFFLTLFSIT